MYVAVAVFIYQVFFGWRKICVEFRKKVDPDLPFYYHTTCHDRFYVDIMPNFNDKPSKPKRPARLPTRELFGHGANRLATIATRGKGSLRATFHKEPISLPPLHPSQQLQLEHAYSKTT